MRRSAPLADCWNRWFPHCRRRGRQRGEVAPLEV